MAADTPGTESYKIVNPLSVQFKVFTAEDIRQLSVLKITNPVSFDALGHPFKGGLYDPVMGPMNEKTGNCGTCFKSMTMCPGHVGHIELPVVVVNPLFHKTVQTILSRSCLHCCRIQMSLETKRLLKLQLQLVDAGLITDALDADCVMSELIKSSSSEMTQENGKLESYKDLLRNRNAVLNNFKNKNVYKIYDRFVGETLKGIKNKTCLFCKQALTKLTKINNKLMHVLYVTENSKMVKKNVCLLPDLCRDHLRKLWDNDKEIVQLIVPILKSVRVGEPTDVFFLESVLVPPPVVRPVNHLNTKLVEHPQSQTFKQILKVNFLIRSCIAVLQNYKDGQQLESSIPDDVRTLLAGVRGELYLDKLHNLWQDLQKHIDYLISSDDATSGELGLKQIIEKKTGIIRSNMMGKRVNFAARSVITPDPNINIDEIGIPEAIAVKLSYPIYVTPWNCEYLRKLVINGPEKHPGATMIENEDGTIVAIPPWSKKRREGLAMRLLTPSSSATSATSTGMKIVHRHLINGDVMLLNRQPTLHKPSIMAHKARVLKGEKTLRLHYANCKSYNADFDGDEMNAHFPQNEIARSEGLHILNVSNQYLVPKDGTPLSGLIQDHVIAGVRLTLRGKFFNKSEYHQLVFQGLSHMNRRIKLLPPTILKPQRLWSGKQVLSTLIINIAPKDKVPISLIGTSKINSRAWQTKPRRPWQAGGTAFFNESNMSESEVIIHKGELLSGILDKSHFGATPYSLVHGFYELYGGSFSSLLLSSFAKIFTYYLQLEGFTLGVKDILVVPEADEIRSRIIRECRQSGDSIASDALGAETETGDSLTSDIEKALVKNPKFKAVLDRKYKVALDKYTNNINKACLPAGLLSQFPENNLQLMVQSGAKGSTVNTMQISCLLGQIELEGKRPPIMISGRSLPSFPPYDTSPRAGGFVDGRFMTGIRPQEFFFHCMAGREGLIDTAVKTSKSGYLQRCLIKHLEGIKIAYDMTVRDSDNSVIQFAYGEDGMDVCKVQYLIEKQLKFLDLNTEAIINREDIDKVKESTDLKKIEKSTKRLKRWNKRCDDLPKRFSPFNSFSASFSNKKIDDELRGSYPGRTSLASKLNDAWLRADYQTKRYHIEKFGKKCPDPVVSYMSPASKFGAINEKLSKMIENYIKSRDRLANIGYRLTSSVDDFRDMMWMKSMKSLAVPGEPVGLLAAQSIGEPSTQMTLNTFHFAGRGDMNVTLGIPRLREILMLASKTLKTPTLDIPFNTGVKDLTQKAENLQKQFCRVTVENVLHQINVHSVLKVFPEKNIIYTLEFKFLPKRLYKDKYSVTPRQIMKHMEMSFFKLMFSKIWKAVGRKTKIVVDSKSVVANSANTKNDDDDEDYDDEPDKNVKVKKEIEQDPEESSEEEQENEDDDNTEVKVRKRRVESQEYEDPESEEEEKSDAENFISEDEEMEESGSKAEDPTPDSHSLEVIKKFQEAKSYVYDRDKYMWCKLTFGLPVNAVKIDMKSILKSAAEASVIREIPKIKRAIIYTNNKDEFVFKTEGINIIEVFKYDHLLNLNKLYSNDIHAIAETYGIEAACRVIIKEVQNVFGVYGIEVDARHLSLIADYMTFNGIYEPMSRKGMESSASPLQQMSFESSLTFLKDAVLKGKFDHLSSTSSCLMVGQPCKSGTGAFTLCNSHNEHL